MSAIAAAAVLLAVLSATLYLCWGSGPVLAVIPWFNPLSLTFQALIALNVAFLALGRHRVLEDPTSWWTGVGFASYGIALVFYVLTWPGLLPGARAFAAALPGTAAWFAVIGSSILAVFLLAGVLSRWPGAGALADRRWAWSVGGWLGGLTLACVLLVAAERRLPLLVRADGTFAPLLVGSHVALAILFGAGTVLSARHYVRAGDSLAGHVAFIQVAWTFTSIWNLIGMKRYDVWWYSQRVMLAAAALVVLFGVLSGYVRLYRRELEKTRAMEEADRRRSEYLSMLSHELRNPLAAISSAVDVASQRVGDDLVLKRVTEVAGRQVGSMTRMLDDLLDVARMTLGRIALRRERVDIAAVVGAAVETIAPRVEALRHRLSVSLPREPLPAEGDAVRLSQAIANLLDNAARYTPPGGLIEVTAAREGEEAVIRVRDTGKGIAPELMPRLFDAFERGEHSTGDAEGGLGLGLAVVRRLVELHGGQVEARSEGLGKGSELIVRLPAL
ncbi:MAG TPA: ATP-binding protein, partial [Vicinamibacterales bacterium]|nr:ATP-binding protein [Vicinamibacterales bacterium]